ncbi:MAG: Ig-like domain-containing protein, partial [Chloroflexota bacterium]|nr:Ig-like domain-containing protein [Chloroflexota bacterium]
MRALQPQLWRLLASVLLISVSCSQFPITLPVTELEEEESIPVTDAPTPAAQLAEIKLPPTVVEFKPRAGQVSATEDTVISVLFDQPMDQASVEAALQVTPEVEGEFTWRNERELSFVPKVLAAAKEYQVSLGTGARSQQGLELTRVLAFSFSTSGPLEVTRVTPSAGAVDFRADTPLLIAFNQPVVALNCTGQVAGKTPDCPALPLSGKPRISGQGFWVNTSLYRFEPRLGWDAGQQYALELARTFTSVAGASLTDPYRWSFTPAKPRILTTQPGNGTVDVLLTTGVRVDFNTPMDTEATGSAFSLVSQLGEPVPGALTWADMGAELIFTPTQRLELGTRYMVMVNENARALTGASLEVPLHWAFTTVPYPAIQSITPQDGSDDVELYQAVQITFEGALDKDSVAEQLVITPTLAAEERYLRWEGQTLHLYWDKEPRTEYCVEVPAGITDIYGHQTGNEWHSCFTTGDLRPIFAATTPLDAITLDASETPEIYVLSRNATLVSLALRTITPDDFLGYEKIEGPILRQWNEYLRNEPNTVELAPVELTRNGAALPTGYYQLSWDLPEASGWRSNLRIAVVDSHLTLKMSTDEALIWATDLASGQPLTETEVRLLDEAGTLVAAGTTDADGLAKLRIGPLESLWDRYLAVLGEPGQPTFGVSVSHWDAGAAPWDFDIDSQYGHFVPYNIYLYSDRPIYRPGQTVRLRGILRAERDVRYSLPDLERTVELSLR